MPALGGRWGEVIGGKEEKWENCDVLLLDFFLCLIGHVDTDVNDLLCDLLW